MCFPSVFPSVGAIPSGAAIYNRETRIATETIAICTTVVQEYFFHILFTKTAPNKKQKQNNNNNKKKTATKQKTTILRDVTHVWFKDYKVQKLINVMSQFGTKKEFILA